MSSSTSAKSERSPDTPVEKLRQELDRLIDAVWTQGERAVEAVGLRGAADRTWIPNVDIVESHDSVHVFVDLPGVDANAIEISLTGNMLSIKGVRTASPRKPDDVPHRCELPAGSFARAVPLPVAVDPDKVQAETKNGVLIVTLAKEERIKPRHIKVESKSPNANCGPVAS